LLVRAGARTQLALPPRPLSIALTRLACPAASNTEKCFGGGLYCDNSESAINGLTVLDCKVEGKAKMVRS
jgi:hypothetical protein